MDQQSKGSRGVLDERDERDERAQLNIKAGTERRRFGDCVPNSAVNVVVVAERRSGRRWERGRARWVFWEGELGLLACSAQVERASLGFCA
jgi:hypothetical protein